MKRNIIYGLTCPDTGIVRYIGKSTVGLERPNKHKTKVSLIAQTHKNNWIKSLLVQNKTYGITVLEECDSKEVLNEREMYWIRFYKETGHNLTNATLGGEGSVGFEFTEASKILMSEKAKKRVKTSGMPKGYLNQWSRKEHKFENNQELKHCSDCDTFKSVDLYHKDKKQWDGLRSICKTCAISRKNKYYTDHVTKMTQEELKQSYESRKDALSTGVKAAYQNNPELRVKIAQARSKPIIRTNPSNGEIKEYASALEAKKDGYQNTNIGVAIKNKSLYKNCYWKFKN